MSRNASEYFVVGDFVTMNLTAKINTVEPGDIACALKLGAGIVHKVRGFAFNGRFLSLESDPYAHYLPERFCLCTEDGTIIEAYPYTLED